MTKIIFGSQDSLDLDVVYLFEELPSLQECKKFCAENEFENRNIVVIKNGIVTESFKGTPDEMNNVLYNTFNLHQQEIENNPVTRIIERDLIIKNIRTIRGILSQLSRTSYRKDIKEALKSDSWKKRLEVLSLINIKSIKDFGKIEDIEAYKFLAFQLGQTVALLEGKEVYTKKEVSLEYPTLYNYLYRIEGSDLNDLHLFYKKYLDMLSEIEIKEDIQEGNIDILFIKENRKFVLKKEKEIFFTKIKIER